MKISHDTIVARCDGTAWQTVDETVVVVTPRSRKIHILSGTGGTIWKCLEEPKEFDDLVDAVCDEWQVDPGIAERDAMRFIGDLVERNIVELRE